MRKFLWAGFLASMVSCPLRAKETGAAFLKVDAGARAAGMGSAFTAAADDATAAFWNPAGLARVERREASASHNDWIGDVTLDHLAYAQSWGGGTWAASLAHLSQGVLDGRGEDRQPLGAFQAEDSAAAVSVARPLSISSSYGLTLRWIDQRIASSHASGFSVDGGIMADAGPRLRLGAAVRNLGPDLKFGDEAFKLPTTAGVGLRAGVAPGLAVSADVRRAVFEGKTSFSLGTEYWLMDRVALRAGYLSAGSAVPSSRTGADVRNTPWSLQMGLGLRIASYEMDYAITPLGEFGNAQRLSFSARF